jgi:hypothetical protein
VTSIALADALRTLLIISSAEISGNYGVFIFNSRHAGWQRLCRDVGVCGVHFTLALNLALTFAAEIQQGASPVNNNGTLAVMFAFTMVLLFGCTLRAWSWRVVLREGIFRIVLYSLCVWVILVERHGW